MNYSPKLKKVIKQIEDILKENDIAGVVALHTPGFCEYTIQVTPKYASVERVGSELHIKEIVNESSPDFKVVIEKLANTSNMFQGLSLMTQDINEQLSNISNQLDATIGATHTPGGFTSQEEIDN